MFIQLSIKKIFNKNPMLSFIPFFAFNCFAVDNVNLQFHMGVGANGDYNIGGVIENQSNEDAYGSAITYITINKKCLPGEARTMNLGMIKKGTSMDFKIPVQGILNSYRILNFSAWNDIGIPLPTEDLTFNIIKKRDAEIEEECRRINIDPTQ